MTCLHPILYKSLHTVLHSHGLGNMHTSRTTVEHVTKPKSNPSTDTKARCRIQICLCTSLLASVARFLLLQVPDHVLQTYLACTLEDIPYAVFDTVVFIITVGEIAIAIPYLLFRLAQRLVQGIALFLIRGTMLRMCMKIAAFTIQYGSPWKQTRIAT